MKGDWVTASGHCAKVTEQFGTRTWLGVIKVGNLEIPTYWDEKLNNVQPMFNLMQKRRGEEEWPPKKSSSNS